MASVPRFYNAAVGTHALEPRDMPQLRVETKGAFFQKEGGTGRGTEKSVPVDTVIYGTDTILVVCAEPLEIQLEIPPNLRR